MGTLLNWVLNEVGKKFNGKLAISLKWWVIGPRLPLVTNRKLHIGFQMTRKSSTFYDLEGHWQPVRSAILVTAGLLSKNWAKLTSYFVNWIIGFHSSFFKNKILFFREDETHHEGALAAVCCGYLRTDFIVKLIRLWFRTLVFFMLILLLLFFQVRWNSLPIFHFSCLCASVHIVTMLLEMVWTRWLQSSYLACCWHVGS